MYKEILTKSLSDIFEKYQRLIQVLFFPTLVLMALDYAMLHYVSQEDRTLNIVLALLSFLVANVFIIVNVHRVLLLGDNSVAKFGTYIFSKREFRVIGLYFGILFLVGIPTGLIVAILSSALNPVISFVFLLPVLVYIMSRISLVYPATAIDNYEFSLLDSWELTSRYKLLCFVTLIIYPILFALGVGIVYGLVIKLFSWIIGTDLSILYTLLNVVISVFIVSALSNTYKYIIAQENTEDI